MLDTIQTWLAERRDRRAAARDYAKLCHIDPAFRRQIANDLAMDQAGLLALVQNGPRTERLLGGTLRSLGTTIGEAQRREPEAMRDVVGTCSRCRFTLTCGRELLSGTAPEHLELYCPNAATLRALAR